MSGTYPEHQPLDDAPEPDPWDDPAYISALDDEAEEGPAQPLSFSPSATPVHPMSLVFGLLMQHMEGFENGRQVNVDEKCCRPFRVEGGPEQEAETGRFSRKEAK